MSYWIYLNGEGNTLHAPTPHSIGAIATFRQDERGKLHEVPETECCLNVTWNYNKVYIEYFGESLAQMLHPVEVEPGRTGHETAELLLERGKKLGTELDDDYWKPTEGNAGAVLITLGAWAKHHPNGQWYVSR